MALAKISSPHTGQGILAGDGSGAALALAMRVAAEGCLADS